jgi:Phosphate transport regulator (distant homolog of PhoU)
MKMKPDKILSLLVEIAQNMKECGSAFSTFEIGSNSDLKVFSEKIKDFEKKGDSILHETNIELNHAFITPIDHEDILVLAEKMDDVVDELEEVSVYFYMYGLTEVDEYMLEFRKYIGSCTEELYNAIELLSTKQLKKIKEHTINVKSYEEICDTAERKAIRKLFKKYTDPIKIIQYKDMYEMLEGAVDACQAVAKTLDIIVMKNI